MLAGAVVAAVTLQSTPAAAATGPIAGYDYSHAIRTLAGCETTELPGNDDGSTGAVAVGFPVNFFGNGYSSLFVNNNGNVTFDQGYSTYSPYNLYTSSTPIIAPFFTDVDTRGLGRTVHYGPGTSDNGQKYFCVDYVHVNEYSYSSHTALNDFQLILWDDSALPGGVPGDFTIEFNYDSILWDHGTARAGFAAGTGAPGSALEIAGSGTPGAFLDGGSNALAAGNANSPTQDGRYRYVLHGGTLPTGTVTGVVTSDDAAPVVNGQVQLCTSLGGFCRQTQTNASGAYSILALADGDYVATAFPPVGSGGVQVTRSVTVSGANDHHGVADLVLAVPHPTPPGTTIGALNGTTVVGGVTVGVIHWSVEHLVTVSNCAGGTGTLTADGVNIYTGAAYHQVFNFVEAPAGTFTTSLPRYDTSGVHGPLTLSEHFNCPGGVSVDPAPFIIYIDPSGTILSNGHPVTGATVTLYRADTSSGPFIPVQNGSDIMSPANRNNPQTTGSDGAYGWDVQSGFYVVHVQKAGCTGNTGNETVSDVLTIPPAVTGLNLTLNCPNLDSTPPALTLPASFSLNATSPTGAVVTYTASALDAVEGAVPITCLPASGATFPINAVGASTTVNCSASDSVPNTANGSFTVHVRGAAEQLGLLRTLVIGYHLSPSGQQQAITSKIDAVTAALASGKKAAACSAIADLRSHVAAQRGKHLTQAQATELTAAINRVGAVVGC